MSNAECCITEWLKVRLMGQLIMELHKLKVTHKATVMAAADTARTYHLDKHA